MSLQHKYEHIRTWKQADRMHYCFSCDQHRQDILKKDIFGNETTHSTIIAICLN